MKRIVVFVFILSLLSSPVLAQRYATVELEEIGELLQKKPLSHTKIQNADTGETVHLGLPIFSQTAEYPYDFLFRFIERYTLHALLLNQKEREQMMKDDKVEMDVTKVAAQDSTKEVSISSDEKLFHVVWQDCEMNFPKDFFLIYGLNKKESDVYFQKSLMAYAGKHFEETTASDSITPTVRPNDKDSILVNKGDSYFIDELNADQYFVTLGDKELPLYSEEYASESVKNLMQMLVNGRFQLEIQQNLYGYQKTSFQIPLSVFSQYCKNQGCKTYVGIENEDETEVRATVVYRNDFFAYNHVLYITVSREALKLHEGAINSKLYCYIPTSNLKKLI